MEADANASVPALTPALGELAERYMNGSPLCFLCDQPATTPLVFVADTATAGRVRGCVFAVCAICLCHEDFQDRIAEVLRQGQRRREVGLWN